MPMDKTRYPANWDEISRRIRFERAQNRCEQCGVANGDIHPVTGAKVMLTVHHKGVPKPDGTPGDRRDKMDCRDENLAALCQRCHLNADRDINIEQALKTKAEQRRQAEQRGLEAGQLKLC